LRQSETKIICPHTKEICTIIELLSVALVVHLYRPIVLFKQKENNILN